MALYQLLKDDPTVAWVRDRTARRATELGALSEELWAGVGTEEARREATAGVLAAGAFARPTPLPDVPPLFSVRLHGFFRGVPGVWACLNPDCSAVPERFRGSRPVGRLYADPRLFCECGARVLELFSCRHCGLLFLGGYEDQQGVLWPWPPDEGERDPYDLSGCRVFCVEDPAPDEAEKTRRALRSVWTTRLAEGGEPGVRTVWEVEGEQGPFPDRCPRCLNFRQPGPFGPNTREVIEPLRTRGPRAFLTLLESAFRVQPKLDAEKPPNYGRTALAFSDSRNDAARLAGDINRGHAADTFRQLLYRVLIACPDCLGEDPGCGSCGGRGLNQSPGELGYSELKARVIRLALKRQIDLSFGRAAGLLSRLEDGDPQAQDEVSRYLNAHLDQELGSEAFGLEGMGLGLFRPALPEKLEPFCPLSPEETRVFTGVVIRLLALDGGLLPAEGGWEASDPLPHYRRRLFRRGTVRGGSENIPLNFAADRRRAGRFVRRVARALVEAGRLEPGKEAGWVDEADAKLWEFLRRSKVLEEALPGLYGMRVSLFKLVPAGDELYRCPHCRRVMAETVLDVCVRCGRKAEVVPRAALDPDFYRRLLEYARPGSGWDDPYPLRAFEHSAQLAREEARRVERRFQDLFHPEERPAEHRVDVLSVTTTMELGIDIGSLLCVGLRNVAPTVAGYQQRAGRAGRRGSALATVFTFARPRSHDQYFFDRPQEIISGRPRPPTLYLGNPVIARRHVNALALEAFFEQKLKPEGSNWGTVGWFLALEGPDRLRGFLAERRSDLLRRAGRLVGPELESQVGSWLDNLAGEVEKVAASRPKGADLLGELAEAGLLPAYGLPTDVVRLNLGVQDGGENGEVAFEDAMQRDLKVALSEYAPGAEVVRNIWREGDRPRTCVFESVGLYDPYSPEPSFSPEGRLVECPNCRRVELFGVDEPLPAECPGCGGAELVSRDYIRPPGFTVDCAVPLDQIREDAGEELERAGSAPPARLVLGETAFLAGECLDFGGRTLWVKKPGGPPFHVQSRSIGGGLRHLPPLRPGPGRKRRPHPPRKEAGVSWWAGEPGGPGLRLPLGGRAFRVRASPGAGCAVSGGRRPGRLALGCSPHLGCRLPAAPGRPRRTQVRGEGGAPAAARPAPGRGLSLRRPARRGRIRPGHPGRDLKDS